MSVLLPLREVRRGQVVAADDLNAVIRRTNQNTPRSGAKTRVKTLGNGFTMEFDAGSGVGGGIAWDGYLWIPTSSGTRVPVAANADTTKINVHVNKSGSPVVTETNDPVPSSWGPDEFWYVKAKLSGMVIVP